ncbi:flagellar protein FlaG [Aliiglaciecola litoralis]|uniref:Flagellar protein FlaG n=1 Tax=Aliiglaciecola litoralis TaxID=582857 RepID=A0ABP3WZ01_9ALTE
MDVNFSQIGQNIAQQDRFAVDSIQVKEQDTLSTQKPEEKAAEDSQERQESADNNTPRNSNSLNIEKAVSEISDFLQATNRQLSFSVDEKSERQVVKVTDSESGEVIRQIPSEEVLALSERIKELQSDVGNVVGVLFNNQA